MKFSLIFHHPARLLILFTFPLLVLSLAACQSVNQEYLKNFEVVWQTVNDTFPDPTFGGVDWKAVHDRYQPLIGAAKNDEEFFLTLNRMLWELNASHSGSCRISSCSIWIARLRKVASGSTYA